MEGGRRHTFAGANFWQGMNLGAEGTGGDRARLVRELDRLRALGVTNVRVVAASEGPDTAPYRTVPALMTSPGVYNEQVFRGLDVFLDELARRGIRAVMVLNNYWEWTGGFGQYVRWSDNSQIPDRIANSSLYSAFIQYVNRFYGCASCQTNYRAHINTVVNRVNTVNGRRYRDDPVIFSWQLANEPRDYPSNWVGDTAQYIKSLDPNHMVSVGSEGTWASNTTGTAATNFFLTTHQSQYIDYATCHIWVEPWGMYNANDSSAAMLPTATNFATAYLRDHDTLARQLGKPLVLEEFGLARDGWAGRQIRPGLAGHEPRQVLPRPLHGRRDVAGGGGRRAGGRQLLGVGRRGAPAQQVDRRPAARAARLVLGLRRGFVDHRASCPPTRPPSGADQDD